jgi:hypothetical protein
MTFRTSILRILIELTLTASRFILLHVAFFCSLRGFPCIEWSFLYPYLFKLILIMSDIARRLQRCFVGSLKLIELRCYLIRLNQSTQEPVKLAEVS